jgi:hypothetical protein
MNSNEIEYLLTLLNHFDYHDPENPIQAKLIKLGYDMAERHLIRLEMDRAAKV